MNEIMKNKINKSIAKYIKDKDANTLRDCYNDLLSEFRTKLDYWERTTYMASMHDIIAIFDEAIINVLNEIELNGGDFVKLFHLRINSRYKNLIRELVNRRKYEQLEPKNNDEAATSQFEIASDFNLENYVTGKKKADQRELIDFLVCGENERTTAIVHTYLMTELRTPTAIGKHLGLDHKQVIRTLTRLASKFDSKQFGDYHDYLVAL